MLRIALLLALSWGLHAQPANPLAGDRWAGVYQNAELRAELIGSAGKYTGTLVFQGRTLPVTATADQSLLQGTFAMGDQRFAFRAARDGDTLTLETEGTKYVLQRTPASRPTETAGAVAEPDKPSEATPKDLIGEWHSTSLVVDFQKGGKAMVGRVRYKYTIQNHVITMKGGDGTFDLPFQLSGNNLTLTIGGHPMAFYRDRLPPQHGDSTPPPAAGRPADLVGRWCFQPNNLPPQCITLRADGTYIYGDDPQSGDSGTWTATDNTLSVVSKVSGPLTYPMEKRNTMLVLAGKTFVKQ